MPNLVDGLLAVSVRSETPLVLFEVVFDASYDRHVRIGETKAVLGAPQLDIIV
jgi:hypothetical protein